MENSTLQAAADTAVLVSAISFIIGLVVLITFFVMTSNIGTITRVIKAMYAEQLNMASSLNKIAGTQTVDQKAKSFDDAIESAIKREHSKI